MSGSGPFADGPGPAFVYFAYRGAAWLAEHTPPRLADRVAALGGRVAYKRAHGKRRTVERNLARVVGEGDHLDGVVKAAFQSYAEYWLETFRLGRYSHDKLLSMVEPVGDSVAVIEETIAAGKGALLITPHLGFYDIGVAWVGAMGWRFTTVAEVLRPKALYEWFAWIRERHGLAVLPARNGKSIRARLADVLDAGGMVALVADRDLGRRGIWTEFFGERTTFPASPTLLLVDKNVPLIAGSITRHGDKFHLYFERVPYTLTGDEQADISAVARVTAEALEKLVRAAPEQWHLFSTNWPSDEPHLKPRGREPDPLAKASAPADAESPSSDPPQIGEPTQ